MRLGFLALWAGISGVALAGDLVFETERTFKTCEASCADTCFDFAQAAKTKILAFDAACEKHANAKLDRQGQTVQIEVRRGGDAKDVLPKIFDRCQKSCDFGCYLLADEVANQIRNFDKACAGELPTMRVVPSTSSSATSVPAAKAEPKASASRFVCYFDGVTQFPEQGSYVRAMTRGGSYDLTTNNSSHDGRGPTLFDALDAGCKACAPYENNNSVAATVKNCKLNRCVDTETSKVVPASETDVLVPPKCQTTARSVYELMSKTVGEQQEFNEQIARNKRQMEADSNRRLEEKFAAENRQMAERRGIVDYGRFYSKDPNYQPPPYKPYNGRDFIEYPQR